MAERYTRRQKKRTRTARKQYRHGAKVIKTRSEDTLLPGLSKKLASHGYDYKKGAWRKTSGKGGKKGKHGLNKKLEKSTKRVAVYDPAKALKGRDLRRGVRALVRLQTRPAVRELSREIGQMKQSQRRELERANLLRQQATGNIRSYYGDLDRENQAAIAQQQASGAALTSGVAGQGVQTQQAIAAAGEAAQRRTGAEPQGQEISARDQLAALIANQSGAAAREQAGLNAQAQGQAGAFEGLQRGLAGAAQLRGAAQASDVSQNVLNQMADVRDRYGRDISQVRGKRADLLAMRPDMANKAFLDLRESERNYLLSRAAIGEKKFEAMLSAKQAKQESKSGTDYLKQAGKTYGKLNKQKFKNSQRLIKLQNMNNRGLLSAKQKGELRRLRAQAALSGGGGGGGGGDNDPGYKPFGNTFSDLRSSPYSPKELAHSKKKRKAAFDGLVRRGSTKANAKKAIHRMVFRYKKKHRGKGMSGYDYMNPWG